MKSARAAQLLSAALLSLVSACSVLTGRQDIPPPWNWTDVPTPMVNSPGAIASPSFLKLAGTIANPTRYPEARTDVEAGGEDSPAIPLDISLATELANAPLSSTLAAKRIPASAPKPAQPLPPLPQRLQTAQPVIQTVPLATSESSVPLALASAQKSTITPEQKTPPPRDSFRTVIGTLPGPVTPVAAPVIPEAVPAPVPAVTPASGHKPDGFVVGPGDVVTITVFGRPELTVNANVSDDGRVPMALIGNVQIGGLSPVQASDRIAAALRDGKYLVDPKVSVVFNEYRSRQISVLGEVKLPGRFPVNTRMSVLDAIALAGGISDLGSQSALILRPEGSVVTRYEVDIDELLDAGVGQQYFDVEGGDTVVVPRAEVFYIYGEVKLPSMYKLRPGMTVVQALSLGGGLTDKGSDRRVEIRRRGADGQLVKQSADLSDAVQPNDVVYVHERLF